MSVTIALEPYDRHLPLFEREWTMPSGATLDLRAVGMLAAHQHGLARHERFLHDHEFDVAELSLASFLMYRQQHDDVIALPIFPRRLFSTSNVWVRRSSEATSWSDLSGTTIGVPTFQMSLGVVARGDMTRAGVDWRSLTWASSHPENVAIDAPIKRLSSPSLFDALEKGEIDAVLTPEIPPGPEFRQVARRLFGEQSQGIEMDHLRVHGYVPIMHLIAMRSSVLERYPDLASELLTVFTEAQDVAWQRYDDPGWSLSLWTRLALEAQDDAFGRSCWPIGLEDNRVALEDFATAATEQGLLERVPVFDELFADVR